MALRTYIASACSQHKCLAFAALACLRSVLTVVAALLTWLTVWHFSETPFPLFYGWTFAIIFHTLGSAITTACAAPTTQAIMAIWRWSSSSHNATRSRNASVQTAPVPTQRLYIDALPQHSQQDGISSRATGDSRSTNDRCSVRLLKFAAATVALLLLFAACLLVHGGAVLADWHLARCYLVVRAAPTKQARQQLGRAQQSARECAVTLALLFLAPAVSIKWALILFLGDFSWIPVLSVITSSISYTIVTSSFLASTFIYSRAWTCKHRVLGVTAVGAAVLGQFLWRLGARSFLVLKFGGEAYFLYTAMMHVVIGIGLIARPKSSRQAYRAAFAANRIQVFLLTLHGAALASDFTTFYEGLKSRYAASRAAWLKKLVFSSNCMAMLVWRILEGIICYVVILTVHAMAPCDPHVTPVADWYDGCAVVAQQWYIWRPRCWGCSMFDRYYIAGDAHQRQVIVMSMLIPAGVLLLFMVFGTLVLWKLLGHVLPDAYTQGGVTADVSTDSADTSTDVGVRHAPAETVTVFTKGQPPVESRYEYALDSAGVRDSINVDWLTTVRHPLEVQPVGPVQQGPGFVPWPSIGCAGAIVGTHSSDTRPGQVSRTSSGVPLCQGLISSTACWYPRQVNPNEAAAHSSGNSILMGPMHSPNTMSPGTSRQPSLDVAPPWALRQEVAGCSSYSVSQQGLLESQTAVHSSSCSFWGHLNTGSVTMLADSQGTHVAQWPGAANTAGETSASSNRLLWLHATGFAVFVLLCDLIVFNCHWVLSLAVLVIGIAYMMWEQLAVLLQRGCDPPTSCQAHSPS